MLVAISESFTIWLVNAAGEEKTPHNDDRHGNKREDKDAGCQADTCNNAVSPAELPENILSFTLLPPLFYFAVRIFVHLLPLTMILVFSPQITLGNWRWQLEKDRN